MRNMAKRIAAISLATIMSVATISTTTLPTAYAAENKVKNVIMLIPDGMSVAGTAIARYMLENNTKGDTNLTMDEYVTALVTTTWDGGPVTDSAPAGTAYATGRKSLNGALGIDANKLPRATILEAAQMQGKAVGLVATSEFMHATPAAYSAHDTARGNYAPIAEQMLNQKIDVLLGTGSAKVPTTTLDIFATAQSKGYQLVNNKSEMQSATATKLWGNLTNTFGKKDNLSYDKDRNTDVEPSLAEMTQKAIDVLKQDSDGFFLMVEGSKIDWAAHANDTIGIVSDVLAFDKAFKAAVDFAKQDGNTIVVSVTDHGNSGISLGNYDLTGYDSAPFSILDPLRGATKTAEGAMALLNAQKTNADEVLTAYGINPNGYTPADVASSDRTTKNNAKVNDLITAFKADPKSANLVKIMNQLAFIGYTTGGHTGEDVPLYVYAPEGMNVPEGLIENTDVAKYVADSMGLNLDTATKSLFVDVTNKDGVSIDKNSKILTLKKNGKTLVIKANQSVATLNGEAKDLNGEVAVYINERFYVPQSALNLVEMNVAKIAGYATGTPNKDGGVAEIVKYNSENKKFYVVNGATSKLDVVSLGGLNAKPASVVNLPAEKSIDVSGLLPQGFVYGDITSVDVDTKHDVIAVAIQEKDFTKSGKVAILDYDGNLVKLVDAGVQPDMVTFTPDYNSILVANEGEPRDGYVTGDPKGSVTIVDLTNGVQSAVGTTVFFDEFDAKRADLVANKVILKKDAKPSEDLEPEYIAVASDSKKAYVALQEANAIGTLDIANKKFTSVKSLGFKDHSVAGNELDAVKDKNINIVTQNNLYGAYMPDGISLMEKDGKIYILTANEGDDREWGDYKNATKTQVGGKDVTALDVTKHDGLEVGKNYLLGGRSFSIWDAETMNQVFDSGSDFEKIVAEKYPDYFNCSNNNTTKDDRSGKKGPEPEDVKVGQIGNQTYAFIGLERIGGVMMYDITDLSDIKYVDYINTRDYSGDIKGDVSPEGLCFIPSEKSPTGHSVLLAANEVSGTVAVYQFMTGAPSVQKYALTNTPFVASSLGYTTTVTVNKGNAEQLAKPKLLVVGSMANGGQACWTVDLQNAAATTAEIAVNNKFSSISVYLLDGQVNWSDTNFTGVKGNILNLTVSATN